MNPVVPVIFAALIVEAVVNVVENVKERETSWKYWVSLFLAIGVSVLVAFNWNIDLFKMAGLPDGQIPFVGAILTGIVISRGSNVVSDLVGLINRNR